MAFRTRDHVPAATALLTLVSLALVFGAVLGTIPRSVLPRAPGAFVAAIPHLNAVISTAALGTVLGGWVAVRRGDVPTHRRLMLVSLGLFAAFLSLYLYRVALRGPSEFAGPGVVYRYVYLPVLGVHVLLAIVCIPLLYYVALLALTRPIPAVRRSAHRRVGRVAAALWSTSFALGDVVYARLYVVY